MAEQAKTDGAAKHEMVTFLVGVQEFCVDIRSVHVICPWRPLIPLLHAPSYVCGMLHIGGSVLPVIDVAVRLGLPASKPTKHHIIMIVEITHQKVGLLVEGGLSEILTISQDMTQFAQERTSQIADDFVSGIVATDGRMISVISLLAILPQEKELHAA